MLHCRRPQGRLQIFPALLLCVAAGTVAALLSCGKSDVSRAADTQSQNSLPEVGVTKITRRSLARYLTISSELVPFQEIDVYAKESGFVSKLYVDYGSHVKKGQLMAVLEIPELQAQLQEDQASIRSASNQVTDAEHELGRVEAEHTVFHLQYERLNNVAQTKPGLVAQQEVDEAHGKDLAAESQIEAAKSTLQATQSQLAVTQSKLVHDQAIYDYSKITAPFTGVVTQRYANLGTLMQGGTNSTQALPLVKLSQEDLFRLVIPVPESYVRYIKTGDQVNVRVPSLDKTFPGTVARFSVDVTGSTRTMHTEVDVPNPQGVLIPGVYAEATLTLDRKGDALVVPLQAINQEADKAIVLVVNSSNQIQNREITLGIQTENDAEVLAGLQDGDEVVISDRSGLRSGELVHPKLTQAAAYNSQS
ncbi:MAG: efflux RND transporter periplasmic adaptor subunit [Acidobacteriaceae bacterium]|nr:efflux RND transporter periplasmic adaptor subunit [Acidobacteriaceae bacterium]MBV9295395.1 efflux RND transporter periplasmic adaptor subunit [Acidobacteriaceae bacterium]